MKQLFSYWSFDLSSVSLMLLIIFYVLKTKRIKKSILISILALLILCFFSPLHILSAHYLFSAHMLVHVILLLCVGPLLILSLSPHRKQLVRLFSFLKQHPAVGWLAGVGIMWFWHIPLLFNTVMAQSHQSSFYFVSIVETLSLMVAGFLFSAPIIHPGKEYRIDALSGVVYLFTACIGCSLLGLLISFAPAGTYHHFLSMHDAWGLNEIILQQWGLTQAIDQQAAGLIMWVPCCLFYVTGAMYLLVQWFKQKEEVIAYPTKL